MAIDWQDLAALALVLSALFYLVWRFWWRGSMVDSGGCSACAGCSASGGQNPPLLVLQRQVHHRGTADTEGEETTGSLEAQWYDLPGREAKSANAGQ